MSKYMTPERLADQIRLRRSAHSGTFIIVEGADDEIFYNRFVDNQNCKLAIADGKDNAIGALKILETFNFTGILAIVDADFSRLEGNLPNSPNLLLTDYHDLEIMLIKSPALDKVINEFCDLKKINNINIGVILFNLGKTIGYLRWVSIKFNLGLDFKELGFSSFFDDKNFTINTAKLIKEVKNNSQRHNLIDQEIQNQINDLQKDNHDLSQVCCGDDLIEILSKIIRKLGRYNWNNSQVNAKLIERDLRLAYEASYFQNTQLYKSIQSWETNNQPYQVLPQVA